MKILVVSPPTFGRHAGGAAKDIFATVGLLQRIGHEVSLYCVGTAAQDQKLIDTFSQKYNVPVNIFMPKLGDWGAWLMALLREPAYADRASYTIGQMVKSEEFASYVSQWKPDQILFICSYGWPAAQFARAHGIPSVFRSHNYEPSFYFEALTVWQRLYPTNWLRYIGKYFGERNAARYSTAIATIPFDDVWRYRKWGAKGVFTFTLTYLPDALKPAWVHKNKKPLDVMFLGASYLVSFHLRGAQALIEDIAPEVLRRAPGALRFHICGSKLPLYLRQQCDGVNIMYEDYVPDLEGFLNTMDIGAFPVWTGKSMKGKVFESLCRGFPVVIPTNCLGGYDIKNKQEILLAETPNEFVDAILSLKDDALREKLSNNAVAYSKKYFSEEHLTSALKEIVEYASAVV